MMIVRRAISPTSCNNYSRFLFLLETKLSGFYGINTNRSIAILLHCLYGGSVAAGIPSMMSTAHRCPRELIRSLGRSVTNWSMFPFVLCLLLLLSEFSVLTSTLFAR